MKRLFSLVVVVFLLLGSLSPVSALSGSDFKASRIIDDSRFFSTNTMSVAEIQAFLNAKVPTCDTNHAKSANSHDSGAPYTCLKNFTDSTIGWAAEAGLCNEITGRTGSAAEIIYWVGQACGINPQVLITLLQKEQSLITDTWPWAYQYRFATGFCVYDTGPPPPSCAGTEGYFGQLYYAARQFKKYGKTPSNYSYRANVNNYIQYHPDVGCGGTSVFIENQATANLYNYTPYQPNTSALNNLYGTGDSCGAYGNRNFWRTYNDWFGSPIGPCSASGDATGGPGPGIMTYNFGGRDRLAYTQLNKTGSGCVEVHVWNPTFNGWVTNIATGARAIDPSSGVLISSRSNIDNQSSINFVTVGNVEAHRFSPSLTKMPGYYDVASNLNGNTTVGSFLAGNFFGNGNDYLAYILHSGTNGGMEIHLFSQTMTKAIGFYDLPTDIGAVTNGTFVAGDFLGRGYAQLAYISYGNTEVHLFDIRNGVAKRIYEVPTNLKNTSASTGTFVAGDFLGIGHAQLVYVIYNNGTRVETHMFDDSLTKVNGRQDTVSNMAGFSP